MAITIMLTRLILWKNSSGPIDSGEELGKSKRPTVDAYCATTPVFYRFIHFEGVTRNDLILVEYVGNNIFFLRVILQCFQIAHNSNLSYKCVLLFGTNFLGVNILIKIAFCLFTGTTDITDYISMLSLQLLCLI